MTPLTHNRQPDDPGIAAVKAAILEEQKIQK